MASRADFLIDLETALKLPFVIGSKRTREGPFFLLWMVDRKMFRFPFTTGGKSTAHRHTQRNQRSNTEGSETLEDVFHCYVLHLSLLQALMSTGAISALPAPFSSTASVIEFGRRFGVSIRPRTGMMTMKNAK
ncbi:hypothetical protein D9M72_611110 [compost metagenome]